MKRKNSFVLLEILIALFIVGITATPLFKHPFQHLKLELEMLYEIELERIAQNRIATLYEDILSGKIPSEIFFADKEPENPSSVKTIFVNLGPGFQKKYEETSSVKWVNQKISNDRIITTLIECKVQYRKPTKKKEIALEVILDTVAQKKI